MGAFGAPPPRHAVSDLPYVRDLTRRSDRVLDAYRKISGRPWTPWATRTSVRDRGRPHPPAAAARSVTAGCQVHRSTYRSTRRRRPGQRFRPSDPVARSRRTRGVERHDAAGRVCAGQKSRRRWRWIRCCRKWPGAGSPTHWASPRAIHRRSARSGDRAGWHRHLHIGPLPATSPGNHAATSWVAGILDGHRSGPRPPSRSVLRSPGGRRRTTACGVTELWPATPTPLTEPAVAYHPY